MSDYQKPAKVHTLLNSSKMRLSAPVPNAKGVWATLSFDLYQGNPRVVVNTNDPALKNQNDSWGNITAKLDVVLFNTLMEFILEAANAPGEYKRPIESNDYPYVNGQKSQEIQHTATIVVGKDAQGLVYISAISTDNKFPKIKFPFAPADGRFFKFKHADGSEYTKPELSVVVAKAYVRMLTEVGNSLMLSQYTPPPPRDFGGNKGGGYNKGGYGGGGGGNRGGYSGGGGGGQRQAAATTVDDSSDQDIPF